VFLTRKVVDTCVLNLKSGWYLCSQLEKWSTSTKFTTAVAQRIIVASHYGEGEHRMCMGNFSKTHCFLLAICSMASSYPRFIRQIIFMLISKIYSPDYIYKVNLSISHIMKAHKGDEIYIHQIWISALNGSAWSTPRPGRSIPEKEPRFHLNEAGWSLGPV
jgi:hypothetical protein